MRRLPKIQHFDSFQKLSVSIAFACCTPKVPFGHLASEKKAQLLRTVSEEAEARSSRYLVIVQTSGTRSCGADRCGISEIVGLTIYSLLCFDCRITARKCGCRNCSYRPLFLQVLASKSQGHEEELSCMWFLVFSCSQGLQNKSFFFTKPDVLQAYLTLLMDPGHHWSQCLDGGFSRACQAPSLPKKRCLGLDCWSAGAEAKTDWFHWFEFWVQVKVEVSCCRAQLLLYSRSTNFTL